MKRIIIGQSVVEWVARHTGEFGNYGAAVGFGVEDLGPLIPCGTYIPPLNLAPNPPPAIIAGVVFNDYNGVNMNMHVASDGSKRWMTRELLWMVFDYAFNQAKVERLTGLVGEKNWQARKFDEHVGFTQETTLARAHPDGRLIVYRMFREDCRWLKIRSRHESLQQSRLSMAA